MVAGRTAAWMGLSAIVGATPTYVPSAVSRFISPIAI
jgi:hypothetical protein